MMMRVTAAQAAAFRLARHHLVVGMATPARAATTVADVVLDTGGIQAQVMSAAEMSIWTRHRGTTRAQTQLALWNERSIVRTSAMRLTLHLLPSGDLPMYIAALRTMQFRRIEYWLGRMGATPRQLRIMVDAVVDALEDGPPKTQQELIAAAKKKIGRRGLGDWIDHSWSGVRPAVIEGRIVYGPPRGSEATFVRADTWLGAQPPADPDDARAELLRRFLRAFGPATPHDFAKWSGLNTSDAKRIVQAAGDLEEVSVDGARGWVLRADVPSLAASELDRAAVVLLGAFDSFLLAHATKEHLVDAPFYKRVYRPQGWISPVVLRGGEIIGVWFPSAAGKTTRLDVELFGRATTNVRRAIERETEALSTFLGTSCQARIKGSQ